VSDPNATRRLDEPEEPKPSRLGAVVGVLAGVLVFLLIVAGVLFLGGNGEEPTGPDLTATPVPTPPEEPTPERTPTPTPIPTPTPTPTPTPVDEEREPTDADAAAFTAAFQPAGARDLESVTVDVTGDGRAEIVVASIANNATRIDVAAWTGTAYEVVFTDQGGPADEITAFSVRDVNEDGVREIITFQRVGQDGESLSIWGWDGDEFGRQVADDGCWDGSHTFGAIGAELRAGQIIATCDDSPLPTAAWTSDVYVWDGEVWVYERTQP
jgi:hypothetical protein